VERKSAENAPDVPAWIEEHITQKGDAYVEARARLPKEYADATIVFRWDRKVVVSFGEAVWDAVEALRTAHPGVTFEIEFP
jgi:hypothetical protein